MSEVILIESEPEVIVIESDGDITVIESDPEFVVVELAEQGPPGPVLAATKTTLGGVIVGDNLTVNNGTIAVPIATANTPGVVQIGANLTVNNGVLSANAGTVANFPWSNITGTPTTLGGYNITDAVTTLPNVTHGNTTLPGNPGVTSASRRPFVGDFGISGNATIYAGFQTSNGTPSAYLGGGATRIGNDILFAELLANPNGVSLRSNRYTVNSSNQTTAIAYQYQFGINGDQFQAILFNTVGGQVYNAGLVVTPTGSYFDAGAFGSLDLTGDDVTVQTNQVEPGPFSVLNRMMADQLYQQVVRKN